MADPNMHHHEITLHLSIQVQNHYVKHSNLIISRTLNSHATQTMTNTITNTLASIGTYTILNQSSINIKAKSSFLKPPHKNLPLTTSKLTIYKINFEKINYYLNLRICCWESWISFVFDSNIFLLK